MARKKYNIGGMADEDIVGPPMGLDALAEVAARARPLLVDSLPFSKAFRMARNAGDKVFTWRGKSYNTRLANESPATPARPPRVARSAAPARSVVPAKSSAPARASNPVASVRPPIPTRVTAPLSRFIPPLTATQTSRLAAARQRGADIWEQARKTVTKPASSRRKGRYAKGGKVDGCAQRGKTKGRHK